MISQAPPGYTLDAANLDTCTTVITRSRAAELIEGYYEERRGQGGRTPRGPKVSIFAVLVVGLAIIRIGCTPSIAEICRVLNTLTPQQRQSLYMEKNRKIILYKPFHAWLARRLEPLDTGIDLPARRVKNAEHRRHVAARTDTLLLEIALAEKRRDKIINALVAGSIDQLAPAGGAGDLVADETIVDLAGPGAGMGIRDSKRRSAAYVANYYSRDGAHGPIDPVSQRRSSSSKHGFGIGLTFVSRLGDKENIQAIPPVVTGVAFHKTTSGYLVGLEKALIAHQENGFDQRKSTKSNARQPNITVDMGYNTKLGFSSLALKYGYAPVVRYPKRRITVWASDGPEHTVDGVAAGPVQISGAFYCPAAAKIIGEHKVVWSIADLGAEAVTLESQDQLLRRLLPLLMGTNSRPKTTREKAGRPSSKGDDVKEKVKIKLVCPAVQARVRCPLKPDSMRVAVDKPLVDPDWNADRYRCCSQSQMTMTYSEEQWKLAQWGLVPGSWEHAMYYEAARSATERQFSRLKSKHESGIEHLKWSPRREPMICILIGLWVASTNLAIQNSFYSQRRKPSSIRMRMKKLEQDLKHPPMKIPPRT